MRGNTMKLLSCNAMYDILQKKKKNFIAVVYISLDLHYTKTSPNWQLRSFDILILPKISNSIFTARLLIILYAIDYILNNLSMLLSTPGRGKGGRGRGSGCKLRACLSAPHGFWSHPGFSGRNATICNRQGIFKKKIKKMLSVRGGAF